MTHGKGSLLWRSLFCVVGCDPPPVERRWAGSPFLYLAGITAATIGGRRQRARAPRRDKTSGEQRPEHQQRSGRDPRQRRAEPRGGPRQQSGQGTNSHERQQTTHRAGGGQGEAGPRPHAAVERWPPGLSFRLASALDSRSSVSSAFRLRGPRPGRSIPGRLVSRSSVSRTFQGLDHVGGEG